MNLLEASSRGRNTDSLYTGFLKWVLQYCEDSIVNRALIDKYQLTMYHNEKMYGRLDTRISFIKAALDYISEMTDRFAVETHNSIISYS
jgi:dGTP triphosphohydrolase